MSTITPLADTANRPPPRVSVVIPAYNAAWSIARTLDSVLSQTYSDFEVIVVDDGSSDRTIDIVQNYIERDRRIRLISQPNLGVAAARNAAIAQARGVFIAPLDADDVWRAENLTCQIAALEAAGRSTPFSFAGTYLLDALDVERKGPVFPKDLRADYVTLLRRNWVNCGSAAVFRRDAALAAGGYSEKLREEDAQGAEDWLLILHLASAAPGIIIRDPLVGYRISESSMSTKPVSMTRSVLRVIEIMRKSGPALAPWHFWAARTNVLSWLLPRWYHAGDWRGVIRCVAGAYLANPLWFTEDIARRTLVTALRAPFKSRRQARKGARTPVLKRRIDIDAP